MPLSVGAAKSCVALTAVHWAIGQRQYQGIYALVYALVFFGVLVLLQRSPRGGIARLLSDIDAPT